MHTNMKVISDLFDAQVCWSQQNRELFIVRAAVLRNVRHARMKKRHTRRQVEHGTQQRALPLSEEQNQYRLNLSREC